MARSALIPGYRFHPTDVELVMYYLKRKLLGKHLVVQAITELNIYDFSPWDLPDKSILKSGDLEWFFFCPKSKKYATGSRANRATETGYWKATGKDRPVVYKERTVAMVKTLVFHLGHPPKGERTNWVMHEYRMEDKDLTDTGVVQDAYVICKVFEKTGAGPKNGAQYGAPFKEEEWDDEGAYCSDASVVVSLSEAITTAPNPSSYNQNSTSVASTSASQSAYSSSLTEAGPSTVVTPSANETLANVSVDDYTMLTADEIACILGGPLGGENNNQEVQVLNLENVGNVAASEDNGVYDELGDFISLEDLNDGAFDMFSTDGAFAI